MNYYEKNIDITLIHYYIIKYFKDFTIITCMVIKMSDIEKEIDRIRDIVDKSFRKAVEELENIKKEVSEWPIPRRLVRLYRELEYIVDSFEETLDDVRKKASRN
jgi:hypothetical protein